MAKFQFSGGGGRVPKLKILKYSKCQEMAKFQFSGGGGGRVPKLKILKVPRNGLISIFRGGGILCQVKVKTQSAKIYLNFNFRGGGGRRLCSESGALSEF